jgi:hypothetical protein
MPVGISIIDRRDRFYGRELSERLERAAEKLEYDINRSS